MAKHHHVVFKVHPNGDIDYKPGLLHASPDDTVSWSCNKAPFFVSFMDETPFADKAYFSPGMATPDEPVLSTANPGTYHYQIGAVVKVKKGGKTVTKVVVSACPEIEIP